MIYKFTTCESVIAKIMADLDSSEVRNRVTDIREWIFEAVDKIGAPMQYLEKESGLDGVPLLKIIDHQVPLPDDLEQLDGVAYGLTPDGPWFPMQKESRTVKSFKSERPKPHDQIIPIKPHDPANMTIDEPDAVVVPAPKPEVHQPMQHKIITSQHQFYNDTGIKYWNDLKPVFDHKRPAYWIKPGWIVTNQDHGFIKLNYKSIATDERGYPLIPDLSSYQEAIYWYVTMKLTFPKFLKGKLGGRSVRDNRQVYTYIQQQWNFYRNQAYAEAMMPTQDDMRTIKNDWLKLIPDVEADDYFFGPVGDRELTYNDYYYGY